MSREECCLRRSRSSGLSVWMREGLIGDEKEEEESFVGDL